MVRVLHGHGGNPDHFHIRTGRLLRRVVVIDARHLNLVWLPVVVRCVKVGGGKMRRKRRYEVVLRRINGRFVKASRPMSKYAAKQFRSRWEEKYDQAYYVEIRPIEDR